MIVEVSLLFYTRFKSHNLNFFCFFKTVKTITSKAMFSSPRLNTWCHSVKFESVYASHGSEHSQISYHSMIEPTSVTLSHMYASFRALCFLCGQAIRHSRISQPLRLTQSCWVRFSFLVTYKPVCLQVECVFTRDILSLCSARNFAQTSFNTTPLNGYTMPVFLGGEHKIWGLTAIILHQTLSLLAPGMYRNRVRHPRGLNLSYQRRRFSLES